MQNVACVFSYQTSNWVSCQKIVSNLWKSYQLLPKTQISKFNYSKELGLSQIEDLAQSIYKEKPEIISFIDHLPHPLLLMAHLASLYYEEEKPRIIFHLFGDFSLNFAQWEKLGQLLVDWPVDFFVASDKQKIFFDSFLKNKQGSLVCPFPVDDKEFGFSEELRLKQRNTWDLQPNEKVYVFTGRLSRQKRILTLIRHFAKTATESTHLYLYGDADSIGDPFLGRWETEGEYFRKIHRLISSYPEKIKNKIHLMGSVSTNELCAIYSGADIFINLSVHNDEDFGMSTAEAQTCGLPCILTDWGGLSSFRLENEPEATHYVPVSFGIRSKVISKTSLNEALNGFDILKTEARSSVAKTSVAKFNLSAVQENLARHLKNGSELFTGFNDFLTEVAEANSISSTPYIYGQKKINPLYKKLYSAYL